MVMPDEALFSELSESLLMACPGTASQIENWLSGSDEPLTTIAEVLWEVRTYGEYKRACISQQVSEDLTGWAKKLTEILADVGLTSLKVFVNRAQGRMRDGQSLHWNPATNRFQAIPWSLQGRQCSMLPKEALKSRSKSLTTLRQAAKGNGYSVQENQAFFSQSDDPWFCILELRGGDDRTAELILSIWQKSVYDDRIRIVEHRPRDTLPDQLRRWILTEERRAAL